MRRTPKVAKASFAFRLDSHGGVPVYRQIIDQVQAAVSAGVLAVGDQLPTVRQVAVDLVINPNTVARSYQELIREGILESRSGRGVFVAERRQVFSDLERNRRLQHVAEQLCHQAIMLGVELPEVLAVLEAQWKELQRNVRQIQTSEERNKK